jgi:hypothetical protein
LDSARCTSNSIFPRFHSLLSHHRLFPLSSWAHSFVYWFLKLFGTTLSILVLCSYRNRQVLDSSRTWRGRVLDIFSSLGISYRNHIQVCRICQWHWYEQPYTRYQASKLLNNKIKQFHTSLTFSF